MSVRLTTLTENTAGTNAMLAEHGLSFLVEVDGRRILLDTGQSFTATENARTLGVNLADVDTIVLSHGHRDHTGGLREVLLEMTRGEREVPVYAHPAVWTARYARRRGHRERFSGMPHRREDLEALGAVFHLSAEQVELAPGIMTTGEVPRVTPFEHVDEGLQVRDGDGWRQDQVPDDQALLVKTRQGLVVVLGCAHSGIVNTLLHARQITGENRVHAVVGGTHLHIAPEPQLVETVRALREFGIRRLGVSHCTGLEVSVRLAQEFGEAFFFDNAGTVVEFA